MVRRGVASLWAVARCLWREMAEVSVGVGLGWGWGGRGWGEGSMRGWGEGGGEGHLSSGSLRQARGPHRPYVARLEHLAADGVPVRVRVYTDSIR